MKKKRVGILGGSFDPAHKGHLGISKEAKKLYKLDYIIWAITKKNPLKKKSNTSLNERLKSAKKIIGLKKCHRIKNTMSLCLKRKGKKKKNKWNWTFLRGHEVLSTTDL